MTNSDGVELGYQIRSIHDSNLNGTGDCSGHQGGDSGGPYYYASGNGVLVAGVVMGRYVNSSDCSRSRFYATMLAGVRQWNSSAVVG